MTFDIGLHEVCVRTGGRTLRHNQIFWDGWFTKFSYPWCSAARALRARGSSAIKLIGRRVSLIAKIAASPSQSSSTLIYGSPVVPWMSSVAIKMSQSGLIFFREIFRSLFVINVIRVQINLAFICPHLQYQWTVLFSSTSEQDV